jgi:hypothetical protein
MTLDDHRIAVYLEQLAAATAETSRDLRLLPLLFRLLLRAPATIVELVLLTPGGPWRDSGVCPRCGRTPARRVA